MFFKEVDIELKKWKYTNFTHQSLLTEKNWGWALYLLIISALRLAAIAATSITHLNFPPQSFFFLKKKKFHHNSSSNQTGLASRKLLFVSSVKPKVNYVLTLCNWPTHSHSDQMSICDATSNLTTWGENRLEKEMMEMMQLHTFNYCINFVALGIDCVKS